MQRMRIGLGIGTVAVASAVAVMLSIALGAGSTSPVSAARQNVSVRVRGQLIHVAESGAAFGLAPFGMRFTDTPQSGAEISLSQAVALAMPYSDAIDASGQLLPNVSLSAEYGSYSADEYGTVQADGTFSPKFQNVPAWIVTFTGSGVVVDSSFTDAVNHEDSVFINGETGAFMGSIS